MLTDQVQTDAVDKFPMDDLSGLVLAAKKKKNQVVAVTNLSSCHLNNVQVRDE
jgi:hypothetical protein